MNMNIENEIDLEEVYDNKCYYKFHDQHRVYKDKWCKAFTFNKDDTKLVMGYNQIIRVYQINKGELKYVQSILGHNFDVNCLQWLNNSNQIISGGHDRKFLFWPINLISKSKFIIKLVVHHLPITCLIKNSQENLLISGSMDQTINFLELNLQNQVWKCSQVLKEHNDTIFALSLSQDENQLISCGYDNLILVLQKSSSQWIVKQKIFTSVHGYRLCFITDYLFTFQPYNKEEMWIYDNRNSLSQFIMTKSIHAKSDCQDFGTLFPHQFFPKKAMLLAKHGHYIHLIKMQDSEDFKIQQSINYRDQCIYGQLSNNGEYLVSWDNKSNLIKIRKYVEQ
ncbi:unnamed protein product [Paramecium pentaurelia]|uniref:Uncharacterized protein n=1 Tax=Paramecium pentaurelia TaxID=43138 RepID=A0A8S1XGW5_9CILI|nr:unnamed protein product [Paramecium pentaurelia]